VTIPSPNTRAVTPRANLILPSEVIDSMAGTALVPQGTAEFPAARLELKHRAVLTTFAARWRTKHNSVLRFPVPQALSSPFVAELRNYPLVLIAVLMQLQRLRLLPKFLAAKLELKHYLVPITSVVMRGTMHQPVFHFQSLQARRWCQIYLNASMRNPPESQR